MTATMIAEALDPARAVLALLAAGHTDAAADVLIASGMSDDRRVDLTTDGVALRVTIREAVTS